MKNFKKILILLCAALLLLGGCSVNDYKKLQLKSYDIGSVTNFSYAKASVSAEILLNIGVANPTRSQFDLQTLDVVVYKEDGSRFATATALEPAVILPQSDTLVQLRLDASLFNPMLTMFSGDVSPETMTADIDALVCSGTISKRIRKEKYPLTNMAGKLDISRSLNILK